MYVNGGGPFLFVPKWSNPSKSTLDTEDHPTDKEGQPPEVGSSKVQLNEFKLKPTLNRDRRSVLAEIPIDRVSVEGERS